MQKMAGQKLGLFQANDKVLCCRRLFPVVVRSLRGMTVMKIIHEEFDMYNSHLPKINMLYSK